jgi:ubiquinone/menaquinone biosynthesis C-methylase UbiE
MMQEGKFWDKAADGYAKRPIKDMDAYNQTMDRTRHHLSADQNALEIGCGTGSTALLLAKHVRHMTASDVSARMIEIGRGKASDQGVENIGFLRATPSDGTLANGAYDVVLAFNLLHLMQGLPAVIRRVGELLAPGGLFISKTPCLGEKKNYLRVPITLMKAFGLAPYVNFLKIRDLEQAMTDANFQILETGDYPASLPSRFIVAKKMELH